MGAFFAPRSLSNPARRILRFRCVTAALFAGEGLPVGTKLRRSAAASLVPL